MATTRAREGETFCEFESFVVITCYKCGIPFGVPDHWRQKRMEDQESFYCPNGHQQCYTTSESERLRRRLAAKTRQLEDEKSRADEARRQRDAVRKSHRRMRDRVKNGVCPCCNRTFQNLLRHMQTQHPELGESKTLRQVRESYGMTQADLANEIGVTAQHISNFECGRSVTTWARDQVESWMEDQGRRESQS